MPSMGPDLPVTVPGDQRQVDGDIDSHPVYQTHRGKIPDSREVVVPIPTVQTPDVALRWPED